MTHTIPPADRALVLDGSRSFDRFVEVRGGRLYRAAWFLTGDPHKAEDLVQTALTKAFGRYPTLPDDEAFEAYVRTTLYRTYVSWWRRRWNAEVPTAELPEGPSAGTDTSTRLDLTRALDTLPKMQRAVLVLRYFEDRSVTETADLLGVSESTVKTHASRGCAALRGSHHLSQENR
ncbi:SigE family RNA polymerase sigma factor [Tessaracoccus lacteus]|uniref:SigE family RNA polymerase sigma factor n=1 Tax=Tessaracoccus lacteus TaxID=3041766 RepID=A0ABY8PWZ0_9ACTN|nr:SigE family RNA polymerase sigma factor [Tessaracoccus sp. T21]WGT46831.1 SigE family RNA polymerase sigma factor [Tessaracoccus sp. T21]